jgi:acetyl-CoA C-acetyltransferase
VRTLSVDVVIEGVGTAGFAVATPTLSWKEMMYQAACRAYDDAGGIDPRKDVGGFITCAEDYWEGFGIFDEFTPDQLGGVLRPNFTVTGDALHGLGQGYMLVRTGLMERVVVEAHSKASNILALPRILHYALDPIWNRPFRANPEFVAGLEMNRFLHETGKSRSRKLSGACTASVISIMRNQK